MELKNKYLAYLQENPTIYKIPYIETVPELTDKISVLPSTLIPVETTYGKVIWGQLRDINIKENNKTKEKIIQIYQRGQTISNVGRLRGNMEYLEDCWNIQIQPPAFKYAYIEESNLKFTDAKQSKIRDKYLKIRVRYDGKQYVMVNAIKTFYTISYA